MTESQPPPGHSDATKLITFPRPKRLEQLRQRHQVRWTDAQGLHVLNVEGRMLVGSASAARIAIADPTVSRVHAELEQRGDDVWIHDLGSKNGTFVENVQVTAARVPENGKVRLGETTLSFGREAQPGVVSLWHEDRFGPLIGGSNPMRELFVQLARVAPMDSPVLVQGETGTGKDLVARAIHDASPRARQPFVIIDCASLPEHLLESELFGHARGAFTGATNAREGAIESAHEGTVFLDEIGELPLSMQPKLLRVLESKTVRRIGESSYRQINVRFLSATHRDLPSMINAGAFREDLYFRLSVLPVTVPPLRERQSDIPHLVASFLGGKGDPFSPELMAELTNRPWLGNVRELRNFVERALALGPAEALALSERTPRMTHQSEGWLDHIEREYLRALLARHERNIPAAAAAAGLDRTYIYRLIRKHRV